MQLDCFVRDLSFILHRQQCQRSQWQLTSKSGRQLATTKSKSNFNNRTFQLNCQFAKSSRTDFHETLRFMFVLLLSLLLLAIILPVVECGCRIQDSEPCEAVCITNRTINSTYCTIRALVLLPQDDFYEASLGRVLPVLKVAEEKIREAQLIPPQIRFEWIPQDDRCDASYALINAMDGILKNCSHVIFGPSCDFPLASVGRITKYFNGQGTPLVSVGGATFDFQKKKTSCEDEFYMLLRTGIVSFQSIAELTVKVMHEYKWDRALFLHERNGQMNVAGFRTCYLMMKSLAEQFHLENKTYSTYLLDSMSIKNLTAELEREIGTHNSKNNITSMAMVLLGNQEIKELFPSIGHRVLFTKNLEEYKKLMYPDTENSSIFETQLSDITIESASTSIQEFPFNELISYATEASGSTEKQISNKSNRESNAISNLTELLESSLEGKGLLSVPKTIPLDTSSRLRLVRLIGTYILQNNPERNITAEIYSYWTNEIVQLFTEEKKAVYLHTKLVESGRGITNRLVGKLPDQIHNLKRKYRETGIIAKRQRTNSPRTSSPCSSPSSKLNRFQEIDFNLESDTDCEESLVWLRNSSHPWVTVEEKWKETSRSRLLQLKDMTIDEYFKEYPALQKPTGYLLLQKDFETIYPSNSKGLIESFPAYKKSLFEIAAKRSGKDKYIQNLLSLADTSEEISNLAAFLLIPSLLSVATIKLKGANKKIWRPSKSEVREGLITHVTSDAGIYEAISLRQQKLKELNLTLQPFIIAVVIEAVDAGIKIIFTLNAKYPEESSCAWMFIQYGFYKIKTSFDKTSTATSTLLVELGIGD